MEESPKTRECPRCGASCIRGRCPACGHRIGAIDLVVVRRDDAPPPGDAPGPDVNLVREYKGPTVRQVLAAPVDVLDRLPGRVRSMEQALVSDLAEADRRMDRALGLLLAGPGHRRRAGGARVVLGLVLWLWFAVLLGLLVWVTW